MARTKTASKAGLVFHLDGTDLTTQSVKETQALLEEKLGVSSQILSRAMFHGQHNLNDLLEATDAKFKDELSLLVPLTLWQTATTISRAKSRAAGKRAAECQGMISIRTEDRERLQAKRKQAELMVQEKQAEFHRLLEEYDSKPREISEEQVLDLDVDRKSVV